jgi:hypothetical protein
MILFPWEECGPFSFHFAGVVSRVEGDVAVLLTNRSSHAPQGSELRLLIRLIPAPLQQVGRKFSFNVPLSEVPVFIDGDPPGWWGPEIAGSYSGQERATLSQPVVAGPTGPEYGHYEYPFDGLSHLQSRIAELDSLANGSLRISTIGETHGIILFRLPGSFLLCMVALRKREPNMEHKIQLFFSNRSMRPVLDQLSACDNVPDSLRTWHFEISEDVLLTVRLCSSILREVYEVQENAGLNFFLKRSGSGKGSVSEID